MALNTQTIGPGRVHAFATLGTLLARIGANAQAVVKALQVARMMSTLANMSDSQLDQIGISRSDIPNYAEKLMADE